MQLRVKYLPRPKEVINFHIISPVAGENQHPTKQFEIFSVPEFILIDSNQKVREHFVLMDRVSFKRAQALILRP